MTESRRADRVAEAIKSELASTFLRELGDPRLSSLRPQSTIHGLIPPERDRRERYRRPPDRRAMVSTMNPMIMSQKMIGTAPAPECRRDCSTCSARATLRCASSDEAPRCGVTTTLA